MKKSSSTTAQPDLFTQPPAPAVAPRAFIEAQFPVSKLSKECYKERKSNASQTLTGLGKWWGRKPLILVRATILGLLLPATNDPKKDREVFLRILTMDADGFRLRLKGMPLKEAYDRLTPAEQAKYFNPATTRLKKEHRDKSEAMQQLAFARMSYDEKMKHALRPEEIAGPSEESWGIINAHLGTKATNLAELVRELGIRRFGHVPRVGDAFCGGGSIPFEAARIGCDAYGSDLNPVAALLTWASLNIVGGGPEIAERVRKAQREVYDAVDRQVTAWGIEHKTEDGPDPPRADAFLYCVEVRCPQTGWMVPLAPSWVIGEKSKAIARLTPDHANKRYGIEILSGVSDAEMRAAKGGGTTRDGLVVHPMLTETANAATVASIREANGGLRMWENDDVVPRPGDVFQERLYCIRWVGADGSRWFAAPTKDDLKREGRVLELLRERFTDWQARGWIPSRRIEPGYNTDQPIRERGWTHWHHLFNPRQLIVLGSFMSQTATAEVGTAEIVGSLLSTGRLADWCSRLCRWGTGAHRESIAQTFFNMALNTLNNYGCKGLSLLEGNWFAELVGVPTSGRSQVVPFDARSTQVVCDFWMTDPPYADAINYHELSDFFLAWYCGALSKLFPSWSQESRPALAVRGTGQEFMRSMVTCYRGLAAQMPDLGFQVVMFTHQDAAVWAELALVLWSSGLQVTSAWCVATETDNMADGNYVQGTVLLVLRKQTGDASSFLDELYPEVEAEVRSQLDAMLALDDEDDPNFADTDYQLAAYAAALRVLTKYRKFEGRDVAQELNRVRAKGEISPVETLIADAVRVAADHLVPQGIERSVWRTLEPSERFYLKGLDMESHGEFRAGAYQELARGFGLREYRNLFESGVANETRLKTSTEFGRRDLASRKEQPATGGAFDGTLTRQVLFAVAEVTKTGDAQKGRLWLRTELPSYWGDRKTILALLAYLARLGATLAAWRHDADSARVLAGAVENDHA